MVMNMSFDTIKLEKGMYNTAGKSFTQVLESLDPSADYAGTPLEGLDAYQRQLKRFDIKVSGAGSDPVQKFFATTDSAALFPEYVGRAVRQGIEEADLLPHIVATTTNINSMDYRTITSEPTADEKSLKRVAEGAMIPETNVRVKENLVKLHKRGRMLVASYEALKFQRLDLFTVTLKQIGAYIARQQLKDAVDVLVNGDGNTNTAAETVNAAQSGTLTYADLLTLWSKFDGFALNTMLAAPDVMLKMLAVDEFKDPATGLNFQATGALSSPLGATLYKSADVTAGQLIGLDRTCALEKVVASDVNIDYDKLIDRQLERAAVTTIVGFAKIYPGAAKVLKV